MPDLLREDAIGKTSDDIFEQFLDRYEAGEGFSKRLLTSTSFLAPIVTFVMCDPNMPMKNRKHSTAEAPKDNDYYTGV